MARGFFKDIYGPNWLLVAITVSFCLLGSCCGERFRQYAAHRAEKLGADPALLRRPL